MTSVGNGEERTQTATHGLLYFPNHGISRVGYTCQMDLLRGYTTFKSSKSSFNTC